MRVNIAVHVINADSSSLSSVAASVADVVEKALREVPHPTEVLAIEVERETI